MGYRKRPAHQRLDVIAGEDRSRVHNPKAALNLAVIRRGGPQYRGALDQPLQRPTLGHHQRLLRLYVRAKQQNRVQTPNHLQTFVATDFMIQS